MPDDLTLKDLSYYYGTEKYHKISLYPSVNLTDGIAYIMKNGYSWFVTDALAVIHCKQKVNKEPFLSITLKVNANEEANLTITDGNNKVLYKQHYKWTSAKIKTLNLYYYDNVLMLAQEY